MCSFRVTIGSQTKASKLLFGLYCRSPDLPDLTTCVSYNHFLFLEFLKSLLSTAQRANYYYSSGYLPHEVQVFGKPLVLPAVRNSALSAYANFISKQQLYWDRKCECCETMNINGSTW